MDQTFQELEIDIQSLQRVQSCIIILLHNLRSLLEVYQLTTFIGGSSSHDPRHNNCPSGFVPLDCCPLKDGD